MPTFAHSLLFLAATSSCILLVYQTWYTNLLSISSIVVEQEYFVLNRWYCGSYLVGILLFESELCIHNYTGSPESVGMPIKYLFSKQPITFKQAVHECSDTSVLYLKTITPT